MIHVTMDCLQRWIEAAGVSSERWNGWACPFFTRDQLGPLVEAIEAIGGSAKWKGDVFVTQFPEEQEPDEWKPKTSGPGGKKKTWAVGAWAWCWYTRAELLGGEQR